MRAHDDSDDRELHNYEAADEDFVATVRKPKVVVVNDDDDYDDINAAANRIQSAKGQALSNTNGAYNQQAQSLSRMEKKKQRWQEEKTMQEQLFKQELDYKQKVYNVNNGTAKYGQNWL
jgi:hypothetical protein